MRVLMLQTIEERDGDRPVRFAKNTHVDVAQEKGEAWEKAGIAIEDPVPAAVAEVPDPAPAAGADTIHSEG